MNAVAIFGAFVLVVICLMVLFLLGIACISMWKDFKDEYGRKEK